MISIIVPAFNEEENIPELLDRVGAVRKSLPEDFELVVVDDGSSDRTVERLKHCSRNHDFIRVVCLKRNYGQTAAIRAGIENSKGDTVVLMDADLQNDPEDIPHMVQMLKKDGVDVVSGWRRDRKDPFLTRIIPSRVANLIISWATGVHLHDYGCTLKAYKREVIEEVRLYGEMHRFIPALARIEGARVIETPVSHHPRNRGKSKYGLGRTFKVLLDLLVVVFLMKYRTRPIHFFGSVAFLFGMTGLGLFLFVCVRAFLLGGIWVSPLLFISLLLIAFSLNFLALGILAEIMARIYFESPRVKPFTIREIIDY